MNFILHLLGLIEFFCLMFIYETATPNFDMIGFATLNGSTTGGQGGKVVLATNLDDLTKYGKAKEPLIIQVNSTINAGPDGAMIHLTQNKTLIGIGSNAFLQGIGIDIYYGYNIIVRNIKFTMSVVNKTHTNDENRQQVDVNDGDIIRVVYSHNVWIDHCEFFNIDPKIQTNIDLYDGLVDVTHTSSHVTISWNYFHDHWKCTLVGASEADNYDRKITFHHNHYNNIEERTPSYRYGTGHIFNNYYENIIHHGINSRQEACLKIEKNYFENSNTPIISANSKKTGNWELIDNYFDKTVLNVTTIANNCSLTIPYQYTADKAESVKDIVKMYAGVGKI